MAGHVLVLKVVLKKIEENLYNQLIMNIFSSTLTHFLTKNTLNCPLYEKDFYNLDDNISFSDFFMSSNKFLAPTALSLSFLLSLYVPSPSVIWRANPPPALVLQRMESSTKQRNLHRLLLHFVYLSYHGLCYRTRGPHSVFG